MDFLEIFVARLVLWAMIWKDHTKEVGERAIK